MPTKSAQQITNLVSILSVLFGVVILVAYWTDLSLIKRLLLITFISLFIYLIIKNSPLKRRLQGNKYFTIDSITSSKRPANVNGTLDKLEGFLSTLSERSEPDFFEQKQKEIYSGSSGSKCLIYTTERTMTRVQPQRSYYSEYITRQQQHLPLPIQSQLPIDHRSGIRLFIPQNLTLIFQQIKKKVSPKKYFLSFCQFIDNLRNLNKLNQQRVKLSDIYYHPQSLVLSNDNFKIVLLQKDYDIMIVDEKYCGEVICEFIEAGLTTILTQVQSHFRNVSEILMKTFAMKINFNLTQTHPQDFDPSRDIILDELIEFIKCWRSKTTLPQKFLPQISLQDFSSIYYSKLQKSTQIVCKFVEFTKSDQEMTFRLYIEVLNAEFKDDKVFVRDNLSILSEQMRKVKHVFLFHKVQNDVSYTYNRIKKFITTNPLVAIMAYFAVDFTTNFHRNNRISKQLKRFFKQKSRLTTK